MHAAGASPPIIFRALRTCDSIAILLLDNRIPASVKTICKPKLFSLAEGKRCCMVTHSGYKLTDPLENLGLVRFRVFVECSHMAFNSSTVIQELCLALSPRDRCLS